jgi:hypothetical protein
MASSSYINDVRHQVAAPDNNAIYHANNLAHIESKDSLDSLNDRTKTLSMAYRGT